MKFYRKLSEPFCRIWCFPIQSDRSCTWMPERSFKDGRRVTWLVLKRLWGKAQFIACHHNHTVYDHNNNVCQESTFSLYFVSYLNLFKLLLLSQSNPTAVPFRRELYTASSFEGRFGNASSMTGYLKHDLKTPNALGIGRWTSMTQANERLRA